MSESKGKGSQGLKSALSANANIFIPRGTSPGGVPNVNQRTGVELASRPYSGGGNPVQEIPAYMINCYPFVNEGDVNRKTTRWPPANSYRPQALGQHFKSQGRGKGVINYNDIAPQPTTVFAAPPPSGNMHLFPMATQPSIPPAQQYFKTEPINIQNQNQNHSLQWATKLGHGRGRGQGQRSWQRESQSPGQLHGRPTSQRDWENVNSVQGHRNSSRKYDSSEIGAHFRPRTIILVDMSVQTDFADSIANLTLRDRPNSLYRYLPPKARDRSKGGNASQGEDVDSDSGYSSPLHRRNMVSNGTHPLEPQYCDKTGFSGQGQVICDASLDVSSTSPSKLSYAAMAQRPPPPRIPVTESSLDDTPPSKNQKGKVKNRNYSNFDKGSGDNLNNKNSSISNNLKPAEQLLNGEEKTKKKRKRVRKRRKKEEVIPDVDIHVDIPPELILHFEDEEEFPDLLSANPSRAEYSVPKRSNSVPIAVNMGFPLSPTSCLAQSSKRDGLAQSPPKSSRSVSFFPTPLSHDDSDQENAGLSESKTARKRRKRREKANQAAEDELAEISLEQHMLRELNMKRNQPMRQPQTLAQRLMSSQPITSVKTNSNFPPQETSKEPIREVITKQSGKKSQQPIAFDIGAMIDALEHKKPDKANTKRQPIGVAKPAIAFVKKGSAPNVLDSNAPVIKRGKERENPKPKKPSPLKKVILKEREERKRNRIIGEDTMVGEPMGDLPRAAVGVGVVTAESDLSQDGVDNSENESSRVQGVPIPKPNSVDIGGTPANSDLSPISQSSPISMTPLSSGVNSPIVGHVTKEVTQAALKIHSRRFREYCHQVLDKDIDTCCTNLLQDLVRFQDRAYHKDPTKAKSKRRLVLGLREVTKHLRLRKIKCVIISPNLEKIQSKGGLDEALNTIIEMCNEQNIPFVFALGRRALGRACAKLVPVSVAGIFNFEGSEANFQQLMDLTAVGRQAYKDMVSVIEREIMENPVKVSSHIYAHMGHSRTPSACSAISFTSSVLSEPISENYPQSEPEVDSKGNEIIKDEDLTSVKDGGKTGGQQEKVCQVESKSEMTSSGMRLRSSVRRYDEIDDGNEADTEDIDGGEMLEQPTLAPSSGDNQNAEEDREDEFGEEEDFEDDFDDEGPNTGAHQNDSEDDEHQDNVKELPHIDSFHASTHDLSAEILSQHSARTGDTIEGASTHSSKTVGEGSLTHPAEISRETHSVQDSTKGSENTSQSTKIVDRERIKTWVEQSQSCLKFQIEDVESTSESQIDAENSSTDDLLDVDSKLNALTVDTYL